MNDSLMCKFCNQRRLSITWENQLLCLCHLWKYKTKKLVTGLAAMICISTVKIRARPWGGIYKQMIWLRFGKVSVRLFCREYKRKRGTDSTSVATLSRDPGKDLMNPHLKHLRNFSLGFTILLKFWYLYQAIPFSISTESLFDLLGEVVHLLSNIEVLYPL